MPTLTVHGPVGRVPSEVAKRHQSVVDHAQTRDDGIYERDKSAEPMLQPEAAPISVSDTKAAAATEDCGHGAANRWRNRAEGVPHRSSGNVSSKYIDL